MTRTVPRNRSWAKDKAATDHRRNLIAIDFTWTESPERVQDAEVFETCSSHRISSAERPPQRRPRCSLLSDRVCSQSAHKQARPQHSTASDHMSEPAQASQGCRSMSSFVLYNSSCQAHFVQQAVPCYRSKTGQTPKCQMWSSGVKTNASRLRYEFRIMYNKRYPSSTLS